MIQFVHRNIAQEALVWPHPSAALNPLAQLNKRLEVCISQLLHILGCNMAIICFQTMLQIMWLKVWYYLFLADKRIKVFTLENTKFQLY